jgi:regulator of protease activity HflC (stomatin/prohibitin superfamily)
MGGDMNTELERESVWKKINLRKTIPVILLAVVVYSIFGKNPMGYYHVVQKWPSGDLKIVTEPGVYWKGLFSDVTRFKVSSAVTFVDHIEKVKKEEKKILDSIGVVFKDNGIGNINGSIRYTVPSAPDKMRLIVQEARNEDDLQQKILRNYINTVMTLVAASYSSTDSIRERGSFIRDIFDSLQHGMIAYEKKIVDGNVMLTPITKTENGVTVPLRMPGVTDKYGIVFKNFTLKKIEYDKQSQSKFDEQRLLEQQRNNAIIMAEKAKQDAITAKAEEEKLQAETKAREEPLRLEARIRAEKEAELARIEAEKEKAVAIINAQKGKEAAQLLLEKARLEKQSVIEDAEGKRVAALKEAEGRQALAKADNSLELRLQMKKDTLVGVANALKDVKVPSAIVGSSSGHTSGNPVLDIFMLNQLKELTKE